MTVITAPSRNYHGTTSMGPGHLDSQIHGFTTARGKNSIIQIPGHEGRQIAGKLGPLDADQVMVADIEAIQTGFQNLDQGRMTMSQIENAAVGMQVEKFFRAVQIMKKGATALAHDEIHAELPEKGDFPGRNVGLE